MATNQVAGGDTILATKENDITIGTTAPTGPATGDLWVDTSGAIPIAKTWTGSVWQRLNPDKYKYKAVQQAFVATTTMADVTATSGNIAFAVEASKAYRIDISFYCGGVGTAGSGGLKIGLTGPASPTAVQAYATYPSTVTEIDSGGSSVQRFVDKDFTTAAGSTFGQIHGENSNNGTNGEGIRAGSWKISILVINGVNAGTVTLQAAQNTAAGTSSIESAFATITELMAE